jgi:hydroxymethylbilane synthase
MPTERPIRIATRRSPLALAQAEMVRLKLATAFPDRSFELVPMLTTGDRNTDRSLADIGGKGLFTKELEEGLLGGSIDLAVHSLKDMETTLRPGLMLAAVLEREDPRDAFVSPHAASFAQLAQGASVGTSSMRRAAQMRILRPDLHIVPLRGNVATRLEKIRSGTADATLLALAGLKRIGMENAVAEILDTRRFIPAAGQGTIAIECCEDAAAMRDMLNALNHMASFHASLAERSVLATLDGSCRTPIAAYARMEGGQFQLDAMIAMPDGSFHVRTYRSAAPVDAVAMGKDAAEELLARGGKACLA